MLFPIFSLFILSIFTSADPHQAPICDMSYSSTNLMKNNMGDSQANVAVELTSSQGSYKSGDVITLSLKTDSDFNGILLYAAPTSDPSKRVGSFVVPQGFQNNKKNCPNSENDNSVLTHTMDQTYSKSQTFTFTAPSTQSDLKFSIIVVRKDGSKFDYSVKENILTITFNNGNSSGANKEDNGANIYSNQDQSGNQNNNPYETNAATPTTSCGECSPAPTVTVIRKCKRRKPATTTSSPNTVDPSNPYQAPAYVPGTSQDSSPASTGGYDAAAAQGPTDTPTPTGGYDAAAAQGPTETPTPTDSSANISLDYNTIVTPTGKPKCKRRDGSIKYE